MTPPAEELIFLFDVDNTLFDNDGLQADLRAFLQERFGPAICDEYWEIFEQLREELSYVDYLGALQRLRVKHLHETRLTETAHFLLNYPFATKLYADALAALRRCRAWGPAVVLSDGDAVFQPLKIEQSGIAAEVEGRVLIYLHKEEELAEVARRFPARHYVMIDDKLRILAAIKAAWGARVTTVFHEQGHYATDPAVRAAYPPADLSLARVGDLLQMDRAALVPED